MISTIIKSHFQINQLISSNNTLVQCLIYTLTNSRYKLLRYGTTFNSIDKLKALSSFLRFNTKPHMTVLTSPTRLIDIFSFSLGGFFYCLLIGNLGSSDIGANAKVSLHAVNNNIQVQFSHSGYDRLRSFFISFNPKSRIFIR